jgi:hypothetical protein
MYQNPWEPNFQLGYPPEKRFCCDKCRLLLADGHHYEAGKPVNICGPCASKKVVV